MAAARYIAFPRDLNNAFPAISKSTVGAAVLAGLVKGKPFDVHDSKNWTVVWSWEQRR